MIHFQRDMKSRKAGKEQIWKTTNASCKAIYLLDYNLQGSRVCIFYLQFYTYFPPQYQAAFTSPVFVEVAKIKSIMVVLSS